MIREEKSFFDTNIFIYALDREDDWAMNILENAIASDFAVTSAISVMEYCTGIYGVVGESGVKVFNNFLKENYISVQAIDEGKALIAARIRAQNKSLNAMDALQLATAIDSGCKVFYTNDRRLKNVKGISLEIKSKEG